MCFSIPYRISKVTKTHYVLQNGTKIKKDTEFNAKQGQYAQVSGDVLVGVMTKTEGEKFYKLLKKLNQ